MTKDEIDTNFVLGIRFVVLIWNNNFGILNSCAQSPAAYLIQKKTRMHSSRMRTARLLPVSLGMHCSGECTWSQGVYLVLGVPGSGGYLPRGGMYLVRGYLVLGGVPGPGGGTWPGGVPGLGVPAQRAVYLVPGVYLVAGGCTWSRGEVPAQVLPPCGQTDTCKNITFANFVCGR